MSLRRILGLPLGILLLAFPAGAAEYEITVGNHDLLPDTPNQAVEIFCSGGGMFEAIDLYVMIGNGLTSPSKPILESLDLVTGTIFETNNFGGQTTLDPTDAYGPHMELESIMAMTEVSSAGLLATVYVDTTGFHEGTWPLSVAATRSGDTTLYKMELGGGVLLPVELQTTLTNGTVTITPEPATIGLLAGGVLLLRRRTMRRS